jgi:hypothetical protein
MGQTFGRYIANRASMSAGILKGEKPTDLPVKERPALPMQVL